MPVNGPPPRRSAPPTSGVTAPPEPNYEAIVDSIMAIGEAGKKLNACGLGRRATLLLIKDATGVAMVDIDKVLNALPNLPGTYVTARGLAAANERRRQQ